MGDSADESPASDSPDSPTRLLRMPALTFTERRALLQFAFRTTSVLMDILAVFVPGDLVPIGLSAMLSDNDPATALLRAGETGAMTGQPTGSMAEGTDQARAVLRQFPEGEAVRACLALPMLAVGPGVALAGVPMPYAPSALIADKDDRLKVLRSGEEYFLVPDRSVREAARALTRPEILTGVRLKAWTGTCQRPKPRDWDQESAWACATHFALAAAARKIGFPDADSMACFSTLLINSSRSAVADLIRALHQGLPDWPEIPLISWRYGTNSWRTTQNSTYRGSRRTLCPLCLKMTRIPHWSPRKRRRRWTQWHSQSARKRVSAPTARPATVTSQRP